MTFKTLLSLVAEEFPKAGIRYMLIGGFAVSHHGVSRNTLDMDFLVVHVTGGVE
ncbi:MAG: hypothetical protein HY360_26190 [Verrucomicrobia bacterium]|nr:hypothetical protein [Verrucomicrobiota bacterium]